MASRLERLRYGAWAANALLLGAAGCAFPHGATGGDPLLGSFNRPIVPTPPPERGGLGLDSPAYDAGARIGVAPPEIPVPAENTSGFMTLPTLTNPRLSDGGRPKEPAYRVTPAAFTPIDPPAPLRPVSHEVLRDPSKVQSMEEGQALLQALGAKAQRTEQRDDGDWVCSCTVGHKTCEGRGKEPMDAMRQLLQRVERER